MKSVFFASIFSFCFFLSPIRAYESASEYARHWIASYILDDSGLLCIAEEDLATIKELVELSVLRAEMTLKAQEAAFRMFDLHWSALQNVVHTRMNPARERPYIVRRPDDADIQEYWDILERREEVLARYCALLDEVLIEGALQSQKAVDGVHNMREQARIIMLDVFADARKELADIYSILFEKSPEDLAEEKDLLHRVFGLSDFLLSQIPHFAVLSLAQVDKVYNLTGIKAQEVIEKYFRLGNHLWHSLESARFEFYQALDHALSCVGSSTKSCRLF